MYIPKKEFVEQVIIDSLRQRKALSQKDLAKMVSDGLKKIDSDYTITPRRARNIALSLKKVNVKIYTRKGKKPEFCPVCKSELNDFFTNDLAGNKILLRSNCSVCGFSAKEGKFLPARYEFSFE